MAPTLPPVVVTVSVPEAAETLVHLLNDYVAVLEYGDDQSTVRIDPVVKGWVRQNR